MPSPSSAVSTSTFVVTSAGDFSRSWDSASQASQACRWSLCLCQSPSPKHRGTSLAHVWPWGLGPEWCAPGWGLGADIADMTGIEFMMCRHVRYARLHRCNGYFHTCVFVVWRSTPKFPNIGTHLISKQLLATAILVLWFWIKAATSGDFM